MNKDNRQSCAKSQKLSAQPSKMSRTISLIVGSTLMGATMFASAQSIEQIRWKGEEQVRQILGEPKSKRGPVGTHASYTMWDYGDYAVAFANKKAFHLFQKNSLKKMDLNEERR